MLSGSRYCFLSKYSVLFVNMSLRRKLATFFLLVVGCFAVNDDHVHVNSLLCHLHKGIKLVAMILLSYAKSKALS